MILSNFRPVKDFEYVTRLGGHTDIFGVRWADVDVYNGSGTRLVRRIARELRGKWFFIDTGTYVDGDIADKLERSYMASMGSALNERMIPLPNKNSWEEIDALAERLRGMGFGDRDK